MYAGLAQLVARLHARLQSALADQRLADPVATLDHAQAIGVAVGNEDAEGEGDGHLTTKYGWIHSGQWYVLAMAFR